MRQLLKWGFTLRSMGPARSNRVIGNRLKPLLVKALLFGKLKKRRARRMSTLTERELVINY